MTTTEQQSVVEILLLLDFNPDDNPTCESVYHRQLGMTTHDAHWWAIAPCGHIDAMCERRRHEFLVVHSWRCTPGCGQPHYVGEVEWVPIT